MLLYREMSEGQVIQVILDHPRISITLVFVEAQDEKFRISTIFRGKKKTRRVKWYKSGDEIAFFSSLIKFKLEKIDGKDNLNICLEIPKNAKVRRIKKKPLMPQSILPK
jgi:hypothetical protein